MSTNGPVLPIPQGLSEQSQRYLAELRAMPQFRDLLLELNRLTRPRVSPYRPRQEDTQGTRVPLDLQSSDWIFDSGLLAGFKRLMLPLFGHDPTDDTAG